MMKFVRTLTIIAFASTLSWAGAILNNGTLRMGVFDGGGLGQSSVGIEFAGFDAIMPGCLCEGWGAAANGTGYNTYGGSSTGFSSAAYTSTGADTGFSTVGLMNGMTVVHTYSSAAGGNLFRVDVSIQNTTAATVTDVRYARTLDWDVPPGHFSDDKTSIYGGSPAGPAGKVFHTSLDPFAVPNPMVTRSSFPNQNRVDQPGDLGGYFILKFGDLMAGDKVDFVTYIGAARTTPLLLSAFATVGIEAYSYSYDFDSSSDVTFGWGFKGLGLPPVFGEVPEPSTYALMGGGLLALSLLSRRRK